MGGRTAEKIRHELKLKANQENERGAIKWPAIEL